MASLKKIMNLDEDSSDPVQVKRERSASSISTQVPTTQTSSSSSTTTSFPGSTSTASRHISLRDQPFARPPRQISSPSAYMAYSQSSDSPALSSPSSSTTSRRSRSSISTGADTMDAMHYPQDHYSSNYGYASSSSYSDPASRGYSTVPATGPPVKYTPITGRVSRAKKGYPVHTCEQCRPSKTFTRAEHLRRHQLSHNPPELVCSVPGCGKTFHRKDLLERHQHRHEQDSRAVSASGSGQHDPRYHRSSPHSQPPMTTGTTGNYVSGIPITSPPWQEVDSTDMRSNSSPSDPNYPIPMSNNPYNNTNLGYGGPVAAWPGQDTQFMGGPEWTPRTMIYGGYPAATVIAHDEYHGVDVCGIPMGTEQILDAHHHGNSTVRSLPPVLVEGQSPETLDIALAAALSPCPVATSQFSPCGSESRQMPNLLAAHVFAPVSLSRATQSDIPAYLEVYWARTYPVYPYIHRASFDGPLDGEATPFELLKCAMAALATQFLDDRKHRIAGSELHTFACQELKTFTDGKHWSLPIMQAVVCCEYYARFRGRDKQSYKPSSNYRKVYELLVEKHSDFSYPLPKLQNKLLSWKSWVKAETLRRLLATCFMLDVHTSAYFKEPPILALGHEHRSLPMSQVPFSTNTNRMWECTDWEAWARLVASDPTLGTVIGRKLEDELTSEDVASMSGFDATILMTGYASQLMSLTGLGEMDAEDTSPSSSSPASRLAKLFPASGVAQAYLAIHFTPLHALLSVSGNSWVLNRKIPEPNEFREHTQILDKWCQSERAAMAVSWAARALLVFLRIPSTTRATAESGSSSAAASATTATPTTVKMDRSSLLAGSRAPWKDVSDYWGVYVCALICWAFGRQTQPGQDHNQRPHDATMHNQASRMVAVRWILEAAQLTPAQLLKWRRRRCTRGVICWARDVLTRDCLAGRSMLYSDAVNVLKRLGETSI